MISGGHEPVLKGSLNSINRYARNGGAKITSIGVRARGIHGVDIAGLSVPHERGRRQRPRACRLASIVYGKKDIARRMADELKLTPAAAADEVDRQVAEILRKLRKGRDARLPGLGILHPEPTGKRPRKGGR